MTDSLEQKILNTLAWFDIFFMPLTKEETYRHLLHTDADTQIPMASLDEIARMLNTMAERYMIGHKHGLYFLPRRDALVGVRQRNMLIVEKKMKIAVRGARLMRWIPFVDAVFVCNTVASGTADIESDIDLFVVIRDQRLWLARLLVVGLLSVFRLRRVGTHISDRLCLSFFVTDAHLDLTDTRIDERDVYLAYWIDQLVPVYDPMNVDARIRAGNGWIRTMIPNAVHSVQTLHRWRVNDWKPQLLLKHFFERAWASGYGDTLEQQAKLIQKKKMERNRGSKQHEQSTAVVISNTMLKFHEHDRRAYFRDEWKQVCANIRTVRNYEKN